MLKRSFAMLLAIVLVLGLLPVNVIAESTADKNTAYTEPLLQHNHAATGDGHICEHCVAAGKTGDAAVPQWQALTGTTLPTTTGHYYLTGDVTVSNTELTNADVVLCLNGYTVTAASGKRFYTMKKDAKLTILDCTAKTVTPENEEDTGYRAGKLVVSTDYAFMFANDSGNNAQLFWYDGILMGGRKAASGGLMSVQQSCDVYFYGGEVRDNSTGSGTAGGPIYLAGSGNTFHAENTAFIGNHAAGRGGVFVAAAAAVVELENCLFQDNSAGTNGGVFCGDNGLKVTARNCTFENNDAVTAGGVFYGKAGYFKAYNSTITGSDAKDYSAVAGTGGGVQVLLDSCRITENAASNASGAVFVPNSSCPLTVSGNTYIYGNTRKGGVPGNIHLQNNAGGQPVVTVKDLTAGAKIGINLNSARLAASKVLSPALSGSLTRAQVIEYFYSDDTAYMIDLADDKLVLTQGHVHTAHLSACDDAACTGHENALYLPWADGKKLPTSGSYYLDTDVELDGDVTMSTGTLNLCLNGHTVTFGNKRFALTGDANVNITDCSAKTENDIYTAGKLTGATNCMFQIGGDTDGSGKKTVVNLFEGIITENSRPKDHAAVVFIEKKATFNMYGGLITENTVGAGSTGRGGVIYLQDNTVTFNMFGGKITKNHAVKNGTYGGNGGAVYSRDRGIVNILGGEISGNTAEADGGAIWAKGGSVTVKNAKITGNEAKNGGSAIYGAGSSVQITLENAEVTGNKAARMGAIYTPNNGCKITLKGATKVTGNQGGNVYLVKDSNTQSPNHSMVAVSGLTTGARIGITMPEARIAAEPHASLTLNGALTEQQVLEYFFADNADYEVILKEDRLLLQQQGAGHKHCICGVEGCTEHAQILCKPWTDTEKLPTSGSYYLDVDVTTKTQPALSTGTLNLCLNGHTVKIQERFAITGDAILNITDCTAKTEQGAYTAGRITGAAGTVFYMTGDNTGKLSAVNFYQGALMGNYRTNYGAAAVAYIQSGASFNMYGGEIYGNTLKATSSTEDKGGIIYINNAKGTFNMYGGTITGNTVFRNQNDNTKGGHGVIFNNGGTVNLLGGKITDNVVEGNGGAVYSNGGSITMENMTISGNKATAGGAIWAKATAITDKGSVITDNTATNGGAFYVNGSTTTLENTQLTGNSASSSSAICGSGGGVQITLDGVTITDNKSSTSFGGAVYIPNNGAKIILKGATKIENNQGGNVYLVKDSNKNNPNHPMITLGDGGLATGAHIGITMPNDRLAAEPYASLALNGALTAQQVSEYFFCDMAKYGVTLAEDRLLIGRAFEDIGHKHCLCNGDITGCDHTEIQWLAWDDPTSLPTSGNFVLTVDVKTTQNVSITGTDVLNLCLNGHTIEAAGSQEGTYKDRIIDMKGQGVLNLTDCQGSGQLTGGTYGAILFESNADSTPVLNLYGGNITGNKGYNYGGAVLLQGGGTFNMYGGKIDGNTMTGTALVDDQGQPELDENGAQKTSGTSGGGGAIALYGGKTTFNLYGGEISGNESLAVTYLNAEGKQAQVGGRGGAIYATGGTVNIYGGKIAENKGHQGGAIYAVAKAKVNILGGEVCGNESVSGGGAIFADATTITVENATICDNVSGSQGGAVYMAGGSLAVKNAKLTDNTANAMSAVRAGGGAKITLDGATITGNTAKDESFPYGALYVPNGACSITLKGAVVISGNTGGNLYLTKDSNKDKPNHPLLTIDGLAEGARVSIAMPNDRMAAEPFASTVLNGQLSDAQVAQYFVCDNDRYAVSLKDDRLHVAKFYLDIGHKHCVCGADLQGCDHKEVNFIAWDDPKSLPTSGNYCLTVDVKTTQNVSILGSDTLNLCLNGHTIEAAGSQEGTYRDRIFDIKGQSTLNITDCTGKGQLTGGTYGVILFESNGDSTPVLNLYGGNITGNKSIAYGGAILVQGGGTFNMYGGKIYGNSMTGWVETDATGKPVLDENGNQKTAGTTGGGGAIALYGAKTTFNMFGGQIYDNECLPVTYLKADGTEATAGGKGGAIFSTRGTVHIAGGEIYGNRANQGGGIYAVINSTVNITGGQIRENATTSHGAGIFADNSKLTVSGGKITKNVSEKGAGGIQISNNKGALTVSGGEITDNKGFYGGGIMCQGRAAITIEGGLIARNSADTAGGVYISTMSPAKMTGGTITENHAINNAGGLYALRTVLDFTGGEISKNAADREAGGVFLYGATLNIDGGKIAGNTSLKHAGGISTGRLTVKGAKLEDKMEGMNNLPDGNGVQFRATVNLISGSIEGNVAGNAGGGVLLQGFATMNVKGGTVKNNKSGSSGGGAYLSNNCTINMSGGTFSGNNAGGTGGGVYMTNAKGTFSGGVFEKNITKKQGAGICASVSEVKLSGVVIRNHYHEGTGAGYTGFTSKTTMSGGSITGNYGKNNGGGMYLQRGSLTITGGSISYNSTKGSGAAIHALGVKTYFYGGYFAGNKCEGTGGGVLVTGRYGYKENGVKKEDVPYVEIHGGTFTENYARNGGAFLIQAGATLKVTGGTFTKNEAPSAGGAMYISNNIKFEITGGTFTENKTNGDGGAINFQGPQGIMDGGDGKIIIENNRARNYGGGFNITGQNADVTVKNVKVSNCFAGNRGGGVSVNTKAHANFEGMEICNNHSDIQGGGFYVGHAPIVFMKDSKIHHNDSLAAGAGIATECVNEVTLENVEVFENETVTKAGGIYTRAAKMHLIDCSVHDNRAGGDGGGVATGMQFGRGGDIGSGGRQEGLIIENSKIFNNSCVGAGGGLHENTGHFVTILNSEITDNTAGTEGSGIWTCENMKVVGLKLTGNTSKNNGYALFMKESDYDGQSFIQALYEFGGDIIIKDNEGGEMFMGAVNAIAVTAEGLTDNTDFIINLDTGVLTNRLIGVYNYEQLGDFQYHVTAGDRSLTEPQVIAKENTQETTPTESTEAAQQPAGEDNTGLYMGIGAIAGVIVLAAVVLVILKKKKAGNATGATKE